MSESELNEKYNFYKSKLEDLQKKALSLEEKREVIVTKIKQLHKNRSVEIDELNGMIKRREIKGLSSYAKSIEELDKLWNEQDSERKEIDEQLTQLRSEMKKLKAILLLIIKELNFPKDLIEDEILGSLLFIGLRLKRKAKKQLSTILNPNLLTSGTYLLKKDLLDKAK
jgi:chromosome segregation ATPase